jgi:hypothetical protein
VWVINGQDRLARLPPAPTEQKSKMIGRAAASWQYDPLPNLGGFAFEF